MSKSFYTRDDCRYCKSKDLIEFLDLGTQPPSNSFLEQKDFIYEKRFPLRLFFCNDCFLVQLVDVVSGADIFDDYYYLSSSSKALVNHFQSMTNDLTNRFGLSDHSVVVDIGCNDGITLDAYQNQKIIKVGVEPSSAGSIASSKGYKVYKDFFNKSVAKKISTTHGIASVVTATNVFAHVDDMESFIEGVPILISDKGVFVVELSYLPKMFDLNMFDIVYHEHLCYLSLHPLIRFLKNYELEVFDVQQLDMGASGPAIRFYIKHINNPIPIQDSVNQLVESELEWGIHQPNKYFEFSKRVFQIKYDALFLIDSIRSSGKKIGGFGAPAKGNTLLNFLDINEGVVSKISENNQKKIGKYTPGSHIEIISDDEFLRMGFDYALLLAWNYKKYFISNSKYYLSGGKFIIPFPIPEII